MMENILEKYPKSVSIEGTKKILNQMEKCICKLNNKELGFFCVINYNNINIPVLITNSNIINEEFIKENEMIKIILNNNEERYIILNDRLKYTNKEYNISIIEINPYEDNINDFMEIDDNLFKDNLNTFYNKHSIYAIIFDNKNNLMVSYGIINKIDKNNIHYLCNIDSSLYGFPIINLLNNKIIGINNEDFNKGIFLKNIIKDFINIKIKNNDNKNEIEITLKIEKEDINKNIYFLDNYEKEENGIKHSHDNLKELNELNADVYINDIKYKYEKYFKPENEGIYKIKLLFKINIKDCSYMFYGCKNIINLDLSVFNTKDTINMSGMFSRCYNIINLDLSYFNTINVSNMSEIFSRCYKLKNLDLSYFNTTNVFNMSEMFRSCEKITNLNLSCFNTRNATNMSGMFRSCGNVTNLNLSSFNTDKVSNICLGCLLDRKI